VARDAAGRVGGVEEDETTMMLSRLALLSCADLSSDLAPVARKSRSVNPPVFSRVKSISTTEERTRLRSRLR
jgi:hypothetical protein